jgi:hypothetical protein
MPAFPNDSLSRARRAGDAVIAAGGSHFEAALASIAAGFDKTSEIQAFKSRVRRVIELGAGHDAVRVRYGIRLRRLRERLIAWREANSFATRCCGIPENTAIYCDIACIIVDRWYHEECRELKVLAAFGRGNGISVQRLRELRLILRLLRRSEHRSHIFGLLDFALDDGEQLAAAE